MCLHIAADVEVFLSILRARRTGKLSGPWRITQVLSTALVGLKKDLDWRVLGEIPFPSTIPTYSHKPLLSSPYSDPDINPLKTCWLSDYHLRHNWCTQGGVGLRHKMIAAILDFWDMVAWPKREPCTVQSLPCLLA